VGVHAIDAGAAETGDDRARDDARFRFYRSGETDGSRDLTVEFEASQESGFRWFHEIEQRFLEPDENSVVIKANTNATDLLLVPANDSLWQADRGMTVTIADRPDAYGVDAATRQATARIADNDHWLVGVRALDPQASWAQPEDTARLRFYRTGETDTTYALPIEFDLDVAEHLALELLTDDGRPVRRSGESGLYELDIEAGALVRDLRFRLTGPPVSDQVAVVRTLPVSERYEDAEETTAAIFLRLNSGGIGFTVDLDIDSYNNHGNALPDRSPEENALEKSLTWNAFMSHRP